MAITDFNSFKQLISQLQIDLTPAEFHGFLCGLVSGGVKDESWKTLTYQFTHDGHAFPVKALTELTAFYEQLNESFEQANTLFLLWQLESDDGFGLADKIAEWSSHFLLALGLAQPKIQYETDEIGEALDDLEEISKLGYNEEDSSDELLEAGEEIVEYLRVVALFLHSHFALSNNDVAPQIH